MTPTIAVLGLGAMGLPMARHLAQSFPIRGYDIDASRCSAAKDFSTACGSAKEAATGADIVLLAVRNRNQLVEVLWGSDGVVPVLDPGAVVLLTSTVGIDVVRDVAGQLAEQRLLLVDAPVSGGPVRAGLGDLLVTVGADDTAYAEALPVLEAMASTLKRVGPPPGGGQCLTPGNQPPCGRHIAAAPPARHRACACGRAPARARAALPPRGPARTPPRARPPRSRPRPPGPRSQAPSPAGPGRPRTPPPPGRPPAVPLRSAPTCAPRARSPAGAGPRRPRPGRRDV